MNNKGYDYAVLLLIVVLICLVMLVVQLQKKAQSVVDVIGNTQYPLLELNNDVRLYEFYLQQAAQIAMESTLKKVATNSVLHITSSVKQQSSDCVLINTLQDPTTFAANLTLYDGLVSTFNKEFLPALQRYERETGWKTSNTFKLVINKTNMVVVATIPTKIPLKNLNSQVVGQAVYRPSVQLDITTSLAEYSQQIDFLKLIIRECSYQQNPACLGEFLPPDWTYDVAEGLYRINILREHGTSCYLMHLPKREL